MSPLDDQFSIKHVFLTHSHLDHTASLPMFLDNVYVPGPECPSVHAHPATLESLNKDLFNGRLWSDLQRLSREESPFLRMVPLSEGQATTVDGLTITPVLLRHVVPTFGYIISDNASAVAIVSDTGPCEHIWDALNNVPKLKAIFLEVSFPNSMSSVAQKSMHLTPRTFDEQLMKLTQQVRILAVHVKPAVKSQVVGEVGKLNRAEVELVEPGREYHF